MKGVQKLEKQIAPLRDRVRNPGRSLATETPSLLTWTCLEVSKSTAVYPGIVSWQRFVLTKSSSSFSYLLLLRLPKVHCTSDVPKCCLRAQCRLNKTSVAVNVEPATGPLSGGCRSLSYRDDTSGQFWRWFPLNHVTNNIKIGTTGLDSTLYCCFLIGFNEEHTFFYLSEEAEKAAVAGELPRPPGRIFPTEVVEESVKTWAHSGRGCALPRLQPHRRCGGTGSSEVCLHFGFALKLH